MKFLLFNVAVIAALVFLFNPDKADFRALADRAYETVGIARDGAEQVMEKVAEKTEAAPKKRVAEPAQKKPEPKPVAPAPKKQAIAIAPVPIEEATPAVTAYKAAVPVKTAPPVAAAAEPKLDPAVAQRRAEVLGLDAPAAGPAEERLMSPDQRRRELFSLAEEMELFYVKRLNR